MTSQDPLPYATPAPRRSNRVRRWLARRAATSGTRMIAFGILAFVGLMCMSPAQNNMILYDWGDRILRISLALFALEYGLSFFQ
jgi:hypothetical protein